jgi:dipeptidyl aminopeptidase/acylaminoacyl peptidase
MLKGALAVGAMLLMSAGAFAGDVPIGHFFTHNLNLQPELSPSGRYLSMVTWDPKVPDRNWLVIYDLKNKSIAHTFGLRQRRMMSQEIFWNVDWLTDNHIVFGSADNYGAIGKPGLTGKIYSINISHKQRRLLQGPWSGNLAGFHILRLFRDDPDHIETISQKWTRGTTAAGNVAPSAFLLKTHGSSSYRAATEWGKGTTANGHRIMTSPLDNGGLVADRDGTIRIASGFNEDTGESRAVYRDNRDAKWQPLPSGLHDQLGERFVGFTADNKEFYTLDYASGGGTLSLYQIDPDSGNKTVLYHNPKVGIDSTLFHNGLTWGPKGKHIAAVETMYGRPKITLIKKHGAVAKILSAFSQSFTGEYPRIVDFSRDGSRAVVEVSSDRDPGRYYLVDVKTMNATALFKRRPDINPKKMAPMRPVQFKARDGATIHGYLTLPKGETPKDLPMIVYLHGGPHGARDHWGFDSWVQLLANRGYAVLQVNFRGSMGYGWNYMAAGFRHWGTTMQYDVIDGTKWAVKQGYADPGRICVFGASYGGYAAIRSAEIAPKLYQCTVGYDGVYDLNMMFDYLGSHHNESDVLYGREVLGSDHADRAKQSPVNHARRLTGGIFLIQGGADKIVPPKQADELRKRLDAAGKHYHYLYKSHEVHGFGKVPDQRELAKKLLAFFNHWIGS